MLSDVELIQRAIARDERAFGDLYDRHATAVYRFAYSQTHDVVSAQELVQETFVTAWQRLADIRVHGDSMLPWLIVTTRNHAQNQRRRRQKHDALPLDEGIARHGAEGIHRENLAHLEEIEWVFEAIHRLGDLDRRIVELCLYEGMTYRAAAKELGLTESGLAKRVERARARLRRMRDDRDGAGA